MAERNVWMLSNLVDKSHHSEAMIERQALNCLLDWKMARKELNLVTCLTDY